MELRHASWVVRGLVTVAGVTLLAAVARSEPPVVEMPRYSVHSLAGDYPALVVSQEGHAVFRLPLASGLSTPGQEETLSNIRLARAEAKSGSAVWEFEARSSLWTDRRFLWTFPPDRIEFQQFASGPRPIERCYFFANGISERWENGTSPGVFANATVYATRYFSPRPNHADQSYFTIAVPQSIGVAGETPERDLRAAAPLPRLREERPLGGDRAGRAARGVPLQRPRVLGLPLRRGVVLGALRRLPHGEDRVRLATRVTSFRFQRVGRAREVRGVDGREGLRHPEALPERGLAPPADLLRLGGADPRGGGIGRRRPRPRDPGEVRGVAGRAREARPPGGDPRRTSRSGGATCARSRRSGSPRSTSSTGRRARWRKSRTGRGDSSRRSGTTT